MSYHITRPLIIHNNILENKNGEKNGYSQFSISALAAEDQSGCQ